MDNNILKAAILGVAVGDALGVPVEFTSRTDRKKDPVKNMRAHGTHNQPRGTWSDDSTMLFCLMETLAKGYDLQDLGNRFINWYRHAYWTPHGSVFDMGNSTRQAILRLESGTSPTLAGGQSPNSNGNGSLMRILPIAFYVKDMPIAQRWQVVSDVSAVSHAHFRSRFSCFIYIEYCLQLINNQDKNSAYRNIQTSINAFAQEQGFDQEELALFDRILKEDISKYPEQNIASSGYVLHTLEASLWCLLNYTSYEEVCLAAVNLGSDTDTTGAVVGGLAGLLFGYAAIPPIWVASLARLEDILDLIERLQNKLNRSSN